jgi:CubicO group peptidase (beta-lactamase class C family)
VSGASHDGTYRGEYESVIAEFVKNFDERGEVGAALCVIVDGHVVIDVWGGWADADRGEPWRTNTLVDIYSAAKPMLAVNLLRLIDRGLIGLDDPVASVWPEFAVHSKQRATLRHALSHLAGVPAIRRDLTNEDLWKWEVMCAALANSEPYCEPGSRLIYHTNTYGHLIGEITRRLTNQMPRDAMSEVATIVGADIHVGVPEVDLARCAKVHFDISASPANSSAAAVSSDADEDHEHEQLREMINRSYFNPPGYSSFGVVNSVQWRSAQVPSTNTHATASALAAWYQALLEPDTLLSSELLSEATKPQSSGVCPVLGEETTFGLGFKPTSPRRPFGSHGTSFGHFGTGGSVGFADPTANVAFGYVMNHVIPRWQSSRNRALIDALYRVVK